MIQIVLLDPFIHLRLGLFYTKTLLQNVDSYLNKKLIFNPQRKQVINSFFFFFTGLCDCFNSKIYRTLIHCYT